MPTTCQLPLLTFGEGGEFSSCLHNCHPVMLQEFSPSEQPNNDDRSGQKPVSYSRHYPDGLGTERRCREDSHREALKVVQEMGTSPLGWETFPTSEKCAVEHRLSLTSSIPCLGDFSLCTTKSKELQVAGSSSAGLVFFFSSLPQLSLIYSKLPQWQNAFPFWGVWLLGEVVFWWSLLGWLFGGFTVN